MNKKLITGILALAMCFSVSVTSITFAEEAVTDKTKGSGAANETREKVKDEVKQEVKEKVKEKLETKKEKILEVKAKIETRKENYKKLYNLLEKKIKLIEARIELLASDTSEDAKTKTEALTTQLEKAKEQLARLEKRIAFEKNLMKKNVEEEYTIEELAKIKEAAEILKSHGDLKLLPVQNIFARGKTLKFDLPPVIKEGRTLIPIRALSEAYGFEVNWDAETKKITITKGDKVLELYVDKKEAYVNGEKVDLDVPPTMYNVNSDNARTVVPLRFIVETMGLDVNWDADTQTIDIDDTQDETTATDEDVVAEDAATLDEELSEVEDLVNDVTEEETTATDVLEGTPVTTEETTDDATTTDTTTTTDETTNNTDNTNN